MILVYEKSIAYASLYDYLNARIGPVKATRWLFSSCPELGGRSPVQAIKDGMEEDVDFAAAAFLASGENDGKGLGH